MPEMTSGPATHYGAQLTALSPIDALPGCVGVDDATILVLNSIVTGGVLPSGQANGFEGARRHANAAAALAMRLKSTDPTALGRVGWRAIDAAFQLRLSQALLDGNHRTSLGLIVVVLGTLGWALDPAVDWFVAYLTLAMWTSALLAAMHLSDPTDLGQFDRWAWGPPASFVDLAKGRIFALLRPHLVPAPVFGLTSAMAHLQSIRLIAAVNVDVREMAAWAIRPSPVDVIRLRSLKTGDQVARQRHRRLVLHLQFVERTRQIIYEATVEPVV